MMEACDIVIANLTPFRGASADSGTLVEIGWFLGRGRPVFGYSNVAMPFAERSPTQVAAVADPLAGLAVEGFSLPDNLMVAGAVEYGGGLPMTLPPDGISRCFNALDVFECCVAAAARALQDAQA
jgi:nucleoside 2-deoxyribosyltransferase